MEKESALTIPVPKPGGELTTKLMQQIVRGVNTANEVGAPAPQGLAWALTCQDEDGNYPLPQEDPIVFPFRSIIMEHSDTPPATAELPPQDADTTLWKPAEWAVRGGIESSGANPPDGYAINRIMTFDPPSGFIAESLGASANYVPIGEIVLVGFSQGMHWMVRQNYGTRVVASIAEGAASVEAAGETEAAGGAAFIARTCYPFLCEPIGFKWTGNHPSLISSPSSVVMKKHATLEQRMIVHNTWPSIIAAGSILAVSRESSGIWVPISQAC